jgi:hypothetical protein
MFQALSILLLSAVPTSARDSVVGLYQSRQMEIGAALELRKDGHFRYQFDYGAVSESAEGDWTFDGKTVRLTSKPMPKPPVFTLVRDDPAPKGEVWIAVEKSGFDWGGRLDAVATAQGVKEKGLVQTDSDGRVDSGGYVLTAIEPLVPVYGTLAGRFDLSTDRGHRLLLRFQANDLGKAAFNSEPLALDDRDLVMRRYGTEIRFLRAGP